VEQELEKRDIQLIIACLIITAVCLVVGIHYFYQAFPEASIDFRITRDQARNQARAFLAARGLDVEGYQHSAVFRYDGRAKTFLERELGLEGANQVIGDPVRLWRWSNRWVRELQKEEFRVQVTTAGELAGFAHLIEEEQEGARLGEGEARYLAEQFLVEVLEREIADLEFVEADAIGRPGRMDYTFTWKLKDFAVNEATYRLRIGIQGDQVGSFAEYLKVPEAWQRSYQELRSRNQTTGQVARFLLELTLLAMVAVFFISVSQQDIRWKTAIIFGSIAFVLTLLARLNKLPLTEYRYETTDTFGSFLTQQLLLSLVIALGQGLSILFLTAAAEPVYRRAFGQQIRISQQFQLHGIRTKRFLIGTIIGLTLTAFFFAYQTLFYLVAEKFGAWSPAQIPYDDMVNTYIPWIMILLIGFMPAVSEEFISRAFSIPFLHKYLKSRWAAVVISAFIWGFAHAGYPQQPFFIRGLEVGLAGLLIGFVMLRWGILAPLVWHYTVDALYTALILLRSDNSYFVISAALSAGLMLLPLVFAVLLYLRRRFFLDPAYMLNQADVLPLVRPQVKSPQELGPEAQLLRELPDSALATSAPPSWRRLAIAAVLVAASLSVFLIQVEQPLDFIDYAITRPEAQRRAAAHLRRQGVNIDTFQVVTYQLRQANGSAVKYILERDRAGRVNQLYQSHLRPSLWVVRFFRPRQKEEYRVAVDPEDRSVYSVHHLLEEDAAGADLGEKEARAIAEEHMRAHGLDPSAFELKESSSEELKARRDHRFVWEAGEGDPRNLDELKFRCQVKVAGDQPVSLRRYLKLPETWLRDREESTTLQAILNGILIALIVAVLLHLLWLLIRQVRGEGLTWTPLLKIGVLGGAISLLGVLNNLPTLYRSYDTRLYTSIFAVDQIVWDLRFLIGVSLAIIGSLVLMSTLYPDWPERLRDTCRLPFLRDTLPSAALVLVAGRSFEHLTTALKQRFAAHDLSPLPSLVSDLDTFWPFWSGLSNALSIALVLPIALSMGLYYVRRVLKTPLYTLLAVFALAALFAGADARDAGEFYLFAGLFLLHALFIYLAVAFLLRSNLLAYILVGFAGSGLERVEALLGLSAPAYRFHGYLLSFLLVLCIFFIWVLARKQARSASGTF